MKSHKFSPHNSAARIVALLCALVLMISPVMTSCADTSADPNADITTADDEQTQAGTTLLKSGLPTGRNDIRHGFPGAAIAFYGIFNRNGIYIADELLHIINNIDLNNISYDTYIAVNVYRHASDIAIGNPAEPLDTAYFTSNGKTHAEYQTEMYESQARIRRLTSLIEEGGEVLKYGKEVLTTTGIPKDDTAISSKVEREVLSAERYEEAIAYYNEDDPNFLDTYIVDGVFLEEQARIDKRALTTTPDILYSKMNKIHDALYSTHIDGDLEALLSTGVVAGECNGKLYVVATLNELFALDEKTDTSHFTFQCMSNEDFRAAFPVDFLPEGFELDRSVTGFNLEKITFTISDTVKKPKTDKEFYDMLAELIKNQRGRYSRIEFRFGSTKEREDKGFVLLDLSVYEKMNYSNSIELRYYGATAIGVKYTDLNFEALRELSLNPDVEGIGIGSPFLSVYAEEYPDEVIPE